jgi:hypothetical protein
VYGAPANADPAYGRKESLPRGALRQRGAASLRTISGILRARQITVIRTNIRHAPKRGR